MMNVIARVAAIAVLMSFLAGAAEPAFGVPGRFEHELSCFGWRLWLDRDAAWKNDDIFLPPVDIGSLPVNPPSCGWDRLDSVTARTVAVPGTVEEYFWGANGNPVGIAGDYRGVSWWSTTFPLDASLKGKRITIAFRSVNLRAEVFVNRRFVGYDVIGNTPFEVDATGAVIDTTGVINRFLNKTRGITLPEFDPAKSDPDYIIIGPHDFGKVGRASYRSRYINAVMDRVANGSTLIVLDQADRWAGEVMDNLFRHPAVLYNHTVNLGTDGRFFAGKNRYLDGLPQSQGMNWEYQVFYRGPIRGIDMSLTGNELIVGLACENRKDIVSALTLVPYVNGQVFLSTLNIVPELTSARPQSAVAKKLLLNLLEMRE